MTIQLHPTRGLDCHRTFCPRCGGDGTSLTMGNVKVFVDKDDRIIAAYGTDITTQSKMVQKYPALDKYNCRPARELERVPDSHICNSCETEIAEHGKLVADGGVYFRCSACHKGGVIRSSDFATFIRQQLKLDAPKPCGVEFSSCAEHGAEEDQ